MSGALRTDDDRLGARVIVGVLLLGAALWMARVHFETIEGPYAERKAELHEQILAGTAPDPYQYKCHLIERVLEESRVITGAPLDSVFRCNILLGLLALVLAHHVWLRTYVGPRDALLGGLLLTALAHVMFRWQWHHPYEPWGLAGACLLLRAHEREAPLWGLVVGSLLLGVYDEEGTFHHIGHTSSFSAKEKRELIPILAPYVTDNGDGFGDGRTPGSPTRWTQGKDLSWVRLSPVLVCEVNYDHLQGGRFRHAARFLRWRPDKPARECTYDQLDVAVPAELQQIFAANRSD